MRAGEANYGVDSLERSSPATLATLASAAWLGRKPLFWGRYFHRAGQVAADGRLASHYDGALENRFLHVEGIRLAIIARQTEHVGGTQAQAGADAAANAEAIFAELSSAYLADACPAPLVFLDVEDRPHLSPSYWKGWAEALVAQSQVRSGGRVGLRPALYANPMEPKTWSALRQAVAGGAQCFGAWVARYPSPQFTRRQWDERQTKPLGGCPAPLLAWQYWASAEDAPSSVDFDVSVVSPRVSAAELLGGLPLPPDN